MFIGFFYELREMDVPVSPTAFLILHRALSVGLISNLEDFYIASRCILIKSERHFDVFDQIFAHHFHGVELPDIQDAELNEIASGMLEQWLKDPDLLASAMNLDPLLLSKMSPAELVEYFKDRLREQTEQHDGGNKWIGRRGTSPVGHSGNHPGGMRVGGISRRKSATKVAMERRYKDYSMTGPLTQTMIGEALKKLRNLTPTGPKDQVNIDKSISHTIRNGGEIQICFDRRLRNRLKIILAIDNGGWSMDPYIPIVHTLFYYSRSQFKDIKTYFFHNTIYETIWEDPERHNKPMNINELTKESKSTRLILVGDANMAPYEVMGRGGAIYAKSNSSNTSLESLKFLAKTLPHSAWLNPIPPKDWNYSRTINLIGEIFPMFELSIDGLGKAVAQLTSK